MLSGICFKVLHAGVRGGARVMGTSEDEGKLAMLFVIAEAAEDGPRDSLYCSYYL